MRKDLVGTRFNRLLVEQDFGWRKVHVLCDCGTKKIVDRYHLIKGKTLSCGCLNRELTSARFTTHGLSTSRFRSTWKGMKRRCEDPTSKGWPWYGGKGIKVCGRWQDFNNFAEDMYDDYTDDLFIDRKDANDDYCKENCRWVSHSEQFKTKLTLEQINEIIADPRPQPEIAEDYGINRSYVSMLKSGARTRHDPELS